MTYLARQSSSQGSRLLKSWRSARPIATTALIGGVKVELFRNLVDPVRKAGGPEDRRGQARARSVAPTKGAAAPATRLGDGPGCSSALSEALSVVVDVASAAGCRKTVGNGR